MQKILALESLRGLAALIVVFDHFIFALYPSVIIGSSTTATHSFKETLISQSPLNIFVNGSFAVICFFALSGFVLSYGYFTRGIDLVTASIKRYFRLAPIVFVSILFSYFLLSFHLYGNVQVADITGSQWFGAFWQQHPTIIDAMWQGLVGTFAVQPGQSSLNPVLWTIYYELIGSFIVFMFLGLAGRDKRRWFLYCILSLVFVNTYYFGFIVGMIICDIFVHSPKLFSRIGTLKKGYKILMITGAIFVASYPANLTSVDDLGVVHQSLLLFGTYEVQTGVIQTNVLYSLAATIFILLLLTSHRIKTLLEKRVFVGLGSISYSLYATHLLMLGSLGSAIFLTFQGVLPYNYAALVTLPIYLIGTLLIAYLFRRYVDEPSISLSRHIIRALKLDRNKKAKDETVELLL